MAGTLKKSIGMFFNLLRKGKLRNDYHVKLDQYNKAFLKKVTDPNFEDGRIHKLYQEGLNKINNWYDVSQSK